MNHKRKTFLRRILSILFITIIPSITYAGWGTHAIDSVGDVGIFNSMAIDAVGYSHVAYYDSSNQDLKYASWTGTSWNIQTVDSLGDVGKYVSIAIDTTTNNSHISYYDTTNGNLKYANWTGISWNIQTVDSYDDAGYNTCMAIDSNNNSHVIYCSYFGELRYAKRINNSWSTQLIDKEYFPTAIFDDQGSHIIYISSNAVRYPSMGIDKNNYLHVAYASCDFAGGYLKYANWNGVSWSTQTVSLGGGYHMRSISIDVDEDNNPYIIHAFGLAGGVDALRYVRWDGDSWSYAEIVSNVYIGDNSSLVIDNENNLRISCYDEVSKSLQYIDKTNNPVLSWTGELWYASGGVYPEEGISDSEYVYRVKYVDIDNDPPASGYPKLHIKKGGKEISSSPFTMAAVIDNDNTYDDGKLYTYTKKSSLITSDLPISYPPYYSFDETYTYSELLPAGNDYTYSFEAYDIWNASATGVGTDLNDFPDISADYIPIYPNSDYLFSYNDGMSIGIHAGTISKTTRIKIETLDYSAFPMVNSTEIKGSNVGIKIELEDGTTKLNKEITLTIPYMAGDIQGLNEVKLKLFYWDTSNSNWVLIPDSSVSTINNVVTAQVNHLTIFRIMEYTVSVSAIEDLSNYPNPFKAGNNSTKIRYTLKDNAYVKINIYDLNGNLVLQKEIPAGASGAMEGPNEVFWDGKNGIGKVVDIGAYICIVECNGEKLKTKIGVR